MVDRVTSLMIQRQSLASINRLRRDLSVTQQQAATGLKINRPSDDPIGASIATRLRAEVDRTAQLDRNGGRASTRLEATEAALGTVLDVLSRARELATAGSTGSQTAEERRIIALEIAELSNELLQAANTRIGGDQLFGGYVTDATSFLRSGDFVEGSPPPTVSFAGDGNEIELEVGEGVQIETTLDGRRVFLGDADGVGGTDAGSQDLFGALASLWEGLTSDDVTAVQGALDELETSENQISLELARVGSRARRLDDARDVLANREVDLRAELSQVQDADTAEVFTNLTLQQTSLEAALQVTSQAFQLNLLNFLR